MEDLNPLQPNVAWITGNFVRSPDALSERFLQSLLCSGRELAGALGANGTRSIPAHYFSEWRAAMVRIIRKKTRHTIAGAARRGAKAVTSVAGEALGAAAKAATGVVLDSTAKVLEAGRSKIERDTPSMQRAAGRAARRTISRSPRTRKKSAPKRRQTAAKRKARRRSR
jgi:hypothetical protein